MMDPAIISLKDFLKVFISKIYTHSLNKLQNKTWGGGVSMLILALLCIKHDYSAMKVKLLFNL